VEVSFVPHDDVLFGFRLRLFSLAAEIGVRPACRAMGVHHSTYYRWKHRVERWGLEALRSQGPPPSTDAKRARSAP
jgi:transposase-like protein